MKYAGFLFLFFLTSGLWFKANAQCPSIVGIMVNSCGGNGNEGLDEFFTIRTGAAPLDINSWIVTFPAGTGTNYCNTGTCGTNNWQLPNTTTANNIANMTPGCPGTMVDPPGGIIPPFSTAIVFAGATPVFTYDFCGSCNTGPIYAVFTNSLSTIGKFSNSAPRTLRVDFGGGCTDTAFYDPANFVPANSDGNYVTYNWVTGQPTYLTEPCNGCITLPIRLVSVNLTRNNNEIRVQCAFDPEGIRPEKVQLLRSTNGVQFSETGLAPAESNGGFDFEWTNSSAPDQTVYYLIEYLLPEGGWARSQVLRASGTGLSLTRGMQVLVFPNPAQNTATVRVSGLTGAQQCEVSIYSVDGKKVISLMRTSGDSQSDWEINTSDLPNGLYNLMVSTPNGIQSTVFSVSR